MPRVPRKSYESSYFHVIVQGYEKEYIFEEDYFKEYFLKLILTEAKKFEVEILEYCIMGNHAHILIYCDKIQQMSLYMKSVNTQYANFFNSEKNRVGYVFRDRFLSEPIQDEKHLYRCIPYIHMNPVEAKIVSKPGDYKYSSYHNFINKDGIVTDSVLIKLFGCRDKYIDLFHFLHSEVGEGLEFKKDEKKLSIVRSEEIIKNILNQYCMANLKDESEEVQRFFCRKLMKERIPAYHIEKILGIDHRRIRKVANGRLC